MQNTSIQQNIYNTPLNTNRRVSEINYSQLFKDALSPVNNVLNSPNSAKAICRILEREIDMFKKNLNAEQKKTVALEEEIFEIKKNEKKYLNELEE